MPMCMFLPSTTAVSGPVPRLRWKTWLATCMGLAEYGVRELADRRGDLSVKLLVQPLVVWLLARLLDARRGNPGGGAPRLAGGGGQRLSMTCFRLLEGRWPAA